MNPHRARLARRIALLLLLSGSGCVVVGPDYSPPTPEELNVPASWQGPASTDAAEGSTLADWWYHLHDPLLSDLIQRAIDANPDLDAAMARFRQARARRRLAGANLWPTLGASTSPQYLRMSQANFAGGRPGNIPGFDETREVYQAGFDASWEPDLFGGQRRAREAATADLQAADAQLEQAQVSLIAEVARNYVELRSAQERIAIGEANLASQSETLALTEWRVQAGLATSLDAEQARTAVEQTRAAIPLLRTARAEALHRIATLLGLAPAALVDELAAPAPIPRLPEPLTVGIPADILRQRPDVAAAERSVAAETARIGEAKAARYPSLTLSGTIGVEALSISALDQGSAVAANVVGRLAQTIFDGGRIGANIENQTAVQAEALATYRSTVLVALEEVENALVSLAESRQRAATLARAVASARNAALLARQQYSAGLIDFQTVLDTERTVLTVDESRVTAEANSAAAMIQLYKALGGGWSTQADEAGAATEAAS